MIAAAHNATAEIKRRKQERDVERKAQAAEARAAKQKLEEARPESIARAARLPGVTPAAISLLLVHLKKEAAG